MLLEILKRTPTWVFVLFAALVFFGAMQARTRQISLVRITILPLVLTGLSLSGLWSAFGRSSFVDVAVVAWIAAIAVALLLNELAQWPRQVTYAPATRTFRVEGSWIPLVAMMLIFFTRYGINVALAIRPGLAESHWLAAGAGAAYGIMSGAFVARAVRILASARSAAAPA